MKDEIPWLEWNPIAVPAVAFYGFNVKQPPFDNALVRKAFAAATDRSEIIELVADLYANRPYPESYVIASSLTPPEILGRNLVGEVGIPFDPEQARAYLQEAGYTDPAMFPQVTLVVNYSGDISPGARQRIAELTISMWKENLGISAVELKVLTSISSLIDYIKTKSPDVYMIAWIGDPLDPSAYIAAMYYSGKEENISNYSNSSFDSLIDQTGGTNIALERQILFIQAEKLLLEDEVVAIPLFYYKVDVQ